MQRIPSHSLVAVILPVLQLVTALHSVLDIPHQVDDSGGTTTASNGNTFCSRIGSNTSIASGFLLQGDVGNRNGTCMLADPLPIQDDDGWLDACC